MKKFDDDLKYFPVRITENNSHDVRQIVAAMLKLLSDRKVGSILQTFTILIIKQTVKFK